MLLLMLLLLMVGELAHKDDLRVDGVVDRDHQDVQARSSAGQSKDNDTGANASAGCRNVDQQGESVGSGEEGLSGGV